MKLAYDAKNAAKVAKKLTRNQSDAQRRQGNHKTEYIIIFKIIKYSEALDNLPSETLFEPAFQLKVHHFSIRRGRSPPLPLTNFLPILLIYIWKDFP